MRKIFALILILLLSLSSLVSCGREYDFYDAAAYSTYSMFAMDTVIDIKLNDAVDESVFKDCESIVHKIENNISRTVAESDIGRLNLSSGERVELTRDTQTLLKLAFDVTEKTDGAFDVTIEPLCSLWNINSAGELFVPPSAVEISETLGHVGVDKFDFDGTGISKIDLGAGIDLGGIGKGYAADATVGYLSSLGYTGTVSFGGNIGVVGRKNDGSKWNIAVKSPFDADEIIGTVKIYSGFVAVSGAYERYAEYNGEIYHHIIDPETGRPSESDLASVAVVSNDGALADALSTALFVMGSEAAIEFYNGGAYDFEAILIKNNGEILLTEKLEESGDFTPYNG